MKGQFNVFILITVLFQFSCSDDDGCHSMGCVYFTASEETVADLNYLRDIVNDTNLFGRNDIGLDSFVITETYTGIGDTIVDTLRCEISGLDFNLIKGDTLIFQNSKLIIKTSEQLELDFGLFDWGGKANYLVFHSLVEGSIASAYIFTSCNEITSQGFMFGFPAYDPRNILNLRSIDI